MVMINWKVELKLKWETHFVLAATGSNNTNDNGDNIIVTIKDIKVYVPAYQNFLAKDKLKIIQS